MEATIILAKCPKRNLTYGIRIQKMSDGDWWRTWAFPIDAHRAHREKYDEAKVCGSLSCTKEYLGCPYCGSMGFVQCGVCDKISCWNGETRMICKWCGANMDNIVDAEDFDVSGGDI